MNKLVNWNGISVPHHRHEAAWKEGYITSTGGANKEFKRLNRESRKRREKKRLVNNKGKGEERNKSKVEIEMKRGKEQKRSRRQEKGEMNRDATSPPQLTSSWRHFGLIWHVLTSTTSPLVGNSTSRQMEWPRAPRCLLSSLTSLWEILRTRPDHKLPTNLCVSSIVLTLLSTGPTEQRS